MTLERVEIGRWQFGVGASKPLNPQVVEQLEIFLNKKWLHVYREEMRGKAQKWLGMEKFAIPSPVVRADLAPLETKDLTLTSDMIVRNLYEIEVRPGGLGILLLLNPSALPALKDALEAVGCVGFVNFQSNIEDDEIAARILGLQFYRDQLPLFFSYEGEAWWIRTNLKEGEVEELEKYSVVPLRLDGYKMDLVRLGLAKIFEQKEVIDWERPFVLKPLQGSRCEGVEVYVPPKEARKIKGISTRQRIIRRLEAGGTFILQDYIPPLMEEYNGVRGFTIWRVFFGWSGKYEYLGGVWNWRPNVRVHGASDCALGPLVLAP